jgi:TrmH family RNA methyltransferase
MTEQNILGNISIVLVDTKTPANIGSVARCMMNMGLSRLILVRPPRDRAGEALKLAAGADTVLQRASRFGSLQEAVADHHLVIGTSRHLARGRKNVRGPREMAGQIVPLLTRNRVAVVFGGEVNGLDKEDLSLCHELVAIPSSDAFPSLNLSHALIVIAYELFVASRSNIPPATSALAPAKDIENFYEHLQKVLQEIGFIEGDRPDRMMSSLRQIFGRARLEVRDVSILRGILTKMDPSRPKRP